MKTKAYKVYGLTDPKDGAIRYVGITRQRKRKRLEQHIRMSRNCRTYKDYWIQSVIREGRKPEIIQIDTASEETWPEKERYWIATLREEGCGLTNLTEGGEGLYGYEMTQEHKDKIGQSNKGKTLPKSARESISRKAKERLSDPDTRKEHRERMAEITSRPEVREKVRAAAKARMTPENRESISRSVKKLWDQGVFTPCPGHTEKTKKVISKKAKERLKDRKNHPRARPVIVNGKRYDTRRDACDAVGIAYQTMTYWLKTGKATYAEA